MNTYTHLFYLSCNSMEYTYCQVAEHKSHEEGYWIYIKKKVYDVTPLCDKHPQGLIARAVINDQCQDNLIDLHKPQKNIKKAMKAYCMGKVTKCMNETCRYCYI